MASELIVQNLKGPASGSNANKVIVPSGHTLDASGWTLVPSAGQIIKKSPVQYFYTSQSTTAGSFVDVTGASISFACDYSNSLVQIDVAFMIGGKGQPRMVAGSHYFDATNNYVYYDASAQTTPTNGSNRQRTFERYYYSPNTTSAVTYKLQVRSHSTNGANGVAINELHSSSSYKYSFIQLTEIAQ